MMHDNEQLDYRGKPRVQTSFEGEESRTVQSDAHRADISVILAQYKQVGIIENLQQTEAMFADISEFTDFADAMLHAKLAESEFMKLPSKVREIFHHDVGEWLDTAHDPEKRDALVQAGVIEGPDGSGGAALEEVGKTDPPPEPSGGAGEGEAPGEEVKVT